MSFTPRSSNADRSQIWKGCQSCKSDLRLRLCAQGFWTTSTRFAGSRPSSDHKAATALGDPTNYWPMDLHAPKAPSCRIACSSVRDDKQTAWICVLLIGWLSTRLGTDRNCHCICAMHTSSGALEFDDQRNVLESKYQFGSGLCPWRLVRTIYGIDLSSNLASSILCCS